MKVMCNWPADDITIGLEGSGTYSNEYVPLTLDEAKDLLKQLTESIEACEKLRMSYEKYCEAELKARETTKPLEPT